MPVFVICSRLMLAGISEGIEVKREGPGRAPGFHFRGSALGWERFSLTGNPLRAASAALFFRAAINRSEGKLAQAVG
jgi:hypothetical protein